MSQRPTSKITPERIQARRDLIKALSEKESDYTLSKGFVGVLVTPSNPPTQEQSQPTTPKEWVAMMPEAAKLNDELEKTLTDSEKLAQFRQNASLHSSGNQPEETQTSKKATRPSGMNLDITVCGVNDLPHNIGPRWTHVISIWDNACRRNKAYRKLVRVIAPEARMLFCFFDDISYPRDPNAPRLRDVKRILAFASEITAEAKVLVHCRAGVSRSTATAYAILCQHSAPGRELANLLHVQLLRDLVSPNELIIKLADKVLKRDGGMILDI